MRQGTMSVMKTSHVLKPASLRAFVVREPSNNTVFWAAYCALSVVGICNKICGPNFSKTSPSLLQNLSIKLLKKNAPSGGLSFVWTASQPNETVHSRLTGERENCRRTFAHES